LKRLLPALLVSAVLVALLVAATGLSWRDVADTLRGLDRGLVAVAFAVYAASFVGRGIRLAVLLPGAGRLPHLTSISTRHIFLAVVLPFRSGEASLPLMLSRECARPLHEGVSVLAFMRVLDLAAVATALLAGLLLTGRLGGEPGLAGGDGVGGAAGGDAAAALAVRALAVFAALALAVALLPALARRFAPLAASPRGLLAFAGRVAAHVAGLRRGQLLLAVATSLATWAATYATCFLLLRAMAAPGALGAVADIDFPTSLIGTTGLHLSAVIPLSPLAGVGTWEAGWAAGYTLVGMPKDAAAASAIASHVLIFAFITLLGGAAWLARLRGARDGRGDRI
jgi:uncharacterized membrane protein YbhN (UPF0104 family)